MPSRSHLPSILRKFCAAIAFCIILQAGVIAAHADSAEEQLAAASALFEAKKYAEAATRLDQFLIDYPKHDKAGAAAYALGRCRTELKQYDKAVPAYQKAVATKDTAILTLAQLGLGEAAVNLKQYEKAAAALEGALTGNLKPAQTSIAWFWLGQCDYELKRYDRSDDAFQHVLHDFGNAEYADGATMGAGLAELKLTHTDDARRKFQTLIDRFPRSEDRPRAQYLIAQIDLDANRNQQARSEFEAFLNTNPPAGALKSQAEDGLIQALFALNDYAAAAPRLESALKRIPATDPQHYRTELSLGNCYYRQKDYQSAAAAYLEASRSTDPSLSGEGLYWAANANLATNHPGDAASLFSKVVARYPKHELASKAALKAADALMDAKQSAAAMTAYHLVVDKYPSSQEAGEARKALGGVLDSITDPAALAAAMKTASPADKQRVGLRLAKMQINGKHYAETTLLLTDLLKAKPDAATAAEMGYLLGLAYEGLAKPALAASAYTDALAKSPAATWASDANGRLAWLYLDLKQPSLSEKAANAALEGKPEKAAEEQDRLALVQALIEQQKWDPAFAACDAILAAGPSKETIGSVVYTQAWIDEKRSRSNEALPLWERLISEFPTSPNTAEALLHVGDSRMKAEKFDEALTFYSRIVSDFPKSSAIPEAHFKIGSTLFNQDKADQAAVEFALAADDKTAGDYIPEALYWAGVALDKAGKKPEAVVRFTKLVTLFPKHARTPNAKIRLAALRAVLGS